MKQESDRLRKGKNRALILSILFCVASFGTTATLAKEGKSETEPVNSSTPAPIGMRIVLAGRSHEVCFTMNVGDQLHYHFDSNVPLVFNLHYHKGKQVITPVPDHKTVAEQGDFRASLKEKYCMMWTNREQKHAQLHISFSVEKAQ